MAYEEVMSTRVRCVEGGSLVGKSHNRWSLSWC